MELKSQLLSSEWQSNGFSFLTSALRAAQRQRQAEGLLSLGYAPHRALFPYRWELTDLGELSPGVSLFLHSLQLGSVLYQRELERRVISMKNRGEQQHEQVRTRSELENREISGLWWGRIQEQGSPVSHLLTKHAKTLWKTIFFAVWPPDDTSELGMNLFSYLFIFLKKPLERTACFGHIWYLFLHSL